MLINKNVMDSHKLVMFSFDPRPSPTREGTRAIMCARAGTDAHLGGVFEITLKLQGANWNFNWVINPGQGLSSLT